MRGGVKISLEYRFQYQFGSGLYHPVPNCRDTERPLSAAGLGDNHPSHGLAPIRLRSQFLAQPGQPVLQPRRLDLFERCPEPAALSWLATHWGVTDRLRQVVVRDNASTGRRLKRGHAVIGYGFFTDGETPRAAIGHFEKRWPALNFRLVQRPAN